MSNSSSTPLKNILHEKIANLIAEGLTPTEAYSCVRKNAKGAAQSVQRLLKSANFAERLAYLKTQASGSAIEKAALSRAWVLEELMDNVRRAKGSEKFDGATANRSLELLGKELGMFVDRNISTVWNGDPKALTTDQLSQLIATLEAAQAEPEPTPEPPLPENPPAENTPTLQ